MTDDIFPAKVISYTGKEYNPSGYYQVIINRGSNNGIIKGQRFIVYALSKELFDPDTKESLGQLEIVRGTGIATHVQEKMTTITTDNYKRIPRRVPQHTLFNLITGNPAPNSKEYIEEFDEKKIPFLDVEKGDLAKPI